ncbi:hypothetical protein ATKI12_8391 [Kitasatospora sp. Ki12]
MFDKGLAKGCLGGVLGLVGLAGGVFLLHLVAWWLISFE